MSADLAGLVSRLEAVAVRLEGIAEKGGSDGGDGGDVAAFVEEYGDYITQYIDPFVAASSKIESDLVKDAAKLVKKLAEEQKRFLSIASQYSAPPQDVLVKLVQPLSSIIMEIAQIKDKNFKDKIFSSYTGAINESVAAFGWVTVAPAPAPYVKECGNGAQFYTNRILKDRQDKEWVKSLVSLSSPLHDYVKKHHTTGVNWKKNAPVATANAGAAPPAPGAPPPPPPAPTPAPAASSSSGGDMSALLKDLNMGSAVTSGLKKVTNDMKTHKNPQLRLQSAVPYKPPVSKPKSVAKPKPAGPVRTPKLELQGKKWIVEHHSGRSDLLIEDVQMKHVVYVYKCEKCTLQIKGKVNSIILDSCKKTGVVFDDVVSGLEFVNCQSVQGQVKGKLPIAAIDKTDGCQLYLSKESLGCEIISAKSSEMNVSVPKDDGEFAEYPIAEQFKSVFDGKTFITEPTENAE